MFSFFSQENTFYSLISNRNLCINFSGFIYLPFIFLLKQYLLNFQFLLADFYILLIILSKNKQKNPYWLSFSELGYLPIPCSCTFSNTHLSSVNEKSSFLIFIVYISAFPLPFVSPSVENPYQYPSYPSWKEQLMLYLLGKNFSGLI